MILQQLGWSYGHHLQMQSMQKAVQLTTFYEFNKYFVNIGRLLSEQINSPHNSEDYLGDKSKVLFKFTPVNEDRIGSIIKKIKEQI